jgi:hypothetical protein
MAPSPLDGAGAAHTPLLGTQSLQDGAWTWAIPLRDGLTSIGVVCEPGRMRREMATRAGLLEHLRQTASLRQLLREASVVDIGTGRQLASGTERFLSAQRWAVIGEAAGSTDPYLSPGTDHIAWHNDLTADLIRRDFEGEGLAPHAARTDALLQHRWRLSLDTMVDQYRTLASYDLRRLRYVYDVFNYFNGLSAWLRDDHLDPAWQQRTLETADVAERAHAEIGRLSAAVAERLRAEGRLFDGNEGGWDEGLFDPRLQRSLPERTPTQERRLAQRLYGGVRKRLLRSLALGWPRPPATGWIEQLFTELRLEGDLAPARQPPPDA